MKIVMIGAGNVAFHLSKALKDAGFTIAQVYSRTENSAKYLADALNTLYTTNIEYIFDDAEFYIFSVSDNAIEELSEKLTTLDGLVLHTAGSVGMDVFANKFKNYGVLYPLQTFSKSRPVNFSEIPVFIEANTTENLQTVQKLAKSIAQTTFHASSAEREQLHLAAVFGCNFVNYLYDVSAQIVRRAGFDLSVLTPLLVETAYKAIDAKNPAKVQTGPAARKDSKVMNKHVDLLSTMPEWKNIYKLLSDNIMSN